MDRHQGAPIVRPAARSDRAGWLAMRERLWPTPANEESEHSGEVDAFFAGDTRIASVVLLAFVEPASMTPVAFAEVSIRPGAEGCTSDRVAYLEGWYVEPDQRGRGVGGALVRAAEDWARAQECTEMASDVEVDNEASLAAHARLGFEEVERVVLLRKDL